MGQESHGRGLSGSSPKGPKHIVGELFMGQKQNRFGGIRAKRSSGSRSTEQSSGIRTQEQDATVSGTCLYVAPSSSSSLKELDRMHKGQKTTEPE